MSSRRTSRRAASSNESELDALSDRYNLKHPNGKSLTYQILPINDSDVSKAEKLLKASLNLLDMKHIVTSKDKEGRNYSQFRAVVLRTGNAIVAAGM
jgi:hypothetical protein